MSTACYVPVPGVVPLLDSPEVPVEGILLTNYPLVISEVAVALNAEVLVEPKVTELPEAVGAL